MRERRTFNNKGVSIVELMVVVLIIGVALGALLTFGTFSLRTASLLERTAQASLLVQDAMEAVKNYRDNTEWDENDPADEYDGLGLVATASPLHLALSEDVPPRWRLLSGAETLGIFTRQVVVEPVERDAQDDIVESGGALDPATRKVTVTVSWEERGAPRELEAITYVTNWR